MKLLRLAIILIFFGFSIKVSGQQYFPLKGNVWLEVKPSLVGFNEKELAAAVDFARGNEYSGSKDLRIAILKGFEKEPYHDVLGLTKKRGGPAGMIIKDGYILLQWGDTKRVDMTFSVTKSIFQQ